MNKMNKSSKIKFGKKIRELREVECLTQERLAALSGLSVFTISRIEKGRGASPTTIIALAQALKVNLQELKGDRNE